VSQVQRQTGHNWHTSKKLLQKLHARGILDYQRKPGATHDTGAYYTLKGAGPKRK
jgi:hypothetical protein